MNAQPLESCSLHTSRFVARWEISCKAAQDGKSLSTIIREWKQHCSAGLECCHCISASRTTLFKNRQSKSGLMTFGRGNYMCLTWLVSSSCPGLATRTTASRLPLSSLHRSLLAYTKTSWHATLSVGLLPLLRHSDSWPVLYS